MGIKTTLYTPNIVNLFTSKPFTITAKAFCALQLIKLMGHASKQMIYEVYGNYVEGLEEDTESILEYYGEDFIRAKKIKNPATYGYGTGYGLGIVQPNYVIPLSF